MVNVSAQVAPHSREPEVLSVEAESGSRSNRSYCNDKDGVGQAFLPVSCLAVIEVRSDRNMSYETIQLEMRGAVGDHYA